MESSANSLRIKTRDSSVHRVTLRSAHMSYGTECDAVFNLGAPLELDHDVEYQLFLESFFAEDGVTASGLKDAILSVSTNLGQKNVFDSCQGQGAGTVGVFKGFSHFATAVSGVQLAKASFMAPEVNVQIRTSAGDYATALNGKTDWVATFVIRPAM